MSNLSTSNSEFDLQKRVRYTNEVPNIDIFKRVHNALNNSLWKWFLGWQKITRYDSYKNEADVRDVSNEEIFAKVVNGVFAEKYGPTPVTSWDAENKKWVTSNPEYHRMELNGVLLPEFDLLMHEVYRYLGHVYPDHPDYADLLTNNEINDQYKQIADFIDYDLNTQIFELINSTDTKGEVFDKKEALKYKLRDLLSIANRRKFYGTNFGFKALASTMGYWGEMYPVMEYYPIKPQLYNITKSETGDYKDSDGTLYDFTLETEKKLNVFNSLYKQKVRIMDYDRKCIPEADKAATLDLIYQSFPGYDFFLYDAPFKTTGTSSFLNLSVGLDLNLKNYDSTYNIEEISTDNRFKSSFDSINSTLTKVTTETSTNKLAVSNRVPVEFNSIYVYPSYDEIFKQIKELDEEGLTNYLSIYTYKNDNTLILARAKSYIFYKELLAGLGISAPQSNVKMLPDIYNEGAGIFSISDIIKIYPDLLKYSAKINSQGIVEGLKYETDYFVEQNYPLQVGKFISSIDFSKTNINSIPENLYKVLSYRKGYVDLTFNSVLLKESFDSEKLYGLFIRTYDKAHWVFVQGNFIFDKTDSGTTTNKATFYIKAIPESIDESLAEMVYTNFTTLQEELAKIKDYVYNWKSWKEKEPYKDLSVILASDFGTENNSKVLNIVNNISSFTLNEIINQFNNLNLNSTEVNNLLSWLSAYAKDETTYLSYFENRKYLYENYKFLNSKDETVELEGSNVGIDCSAFLITPIWDNKTGKAYFTSLKSNYGTALITNISFGCVNFLPIYEKNTLTYKNLNNNASALTLESKTFEINNNKLYYVDISDYYNNLRTTIFNDNQAKLNYFYNLSDYPLGGSFLEDTLLGTYSRKNNLEAVFKIYYNEEINCTLEVDEETYPGKTLVSFNNLKDYRIKGFNIGSQVIGKGIQNETYIEQIVENQLILSKIPTLIGETTIKILNRYVMTPKDMKDDYRIEKKLVNLGINDKGSVFDHGLYGSKDWPNSSLAKPRGIPDISLYKPYKTFNEVVEACHNDNNAISQLSNYTNTKDSTAKVYNGVINPSLMSLNKEIFCELVADKLITKATKKGSSPNLMVHEILDYLESSMREVSKSSENANVGVQLTMQTDTSGYYSLDDNINTIYTDPSVKLRFQTKNWKSTTIPAYVKVGSGGNLKQNYFIKPSDAMKPVLWGNAFFDQPLTTKQQKEFSNDGIIINKRFLWGKDQNLAELEETQSLGNEIFEIPLGEHNVILNYEKDNVANTIINFSVIKNDFKIAKNYESTDETYFALNSSDYVDSKNLIVSLAKNESTQFMGYFEPTKGNAIPILTAEQQTNFKLKNIIPYWLVWNEVIASNFDSKDNITATYEYKNHSILLWDSVDNTIKIYQPVLGTLISDDAYPSGKVNLENVQNNIETLWDSAPDEDNKDRTFEELLTGSDGKGIYKNLSPYKAYMIFALENQKSLTYDLTLGLSSGNFYAYIYINKTLKFFKLNHTYFMDTITYGKPNRLDTTTYSIFSGYLTGLNNATTPSKSLSSKMFNLSLPHSNISKGTFQASLRIDPKFIGDGYVLTCTSTLKNTWAKTGELVKFNVSRSEIKKDTNLNLFYEESYLCKQDSNGNWYEDTESGLKRIALYFENPKYFKNILNIQGSAKVESYVDDNGNYKTQFSIARATDGFNFPLSKLSTEDKLLSYNKVDLRSLWSKDLEATAFNTYKKFNLNIHGIDPVSNALVLGPKFDSNYSSEGLVVQQLMDKLLPYGTSDFDYTFSNKNPVISSASIGKNIKGTSETKTSLDANLKFFKNLLIVKALIKSDNPNILYPTSGQDFSSVSSILRAKDYIYDKVTNAYLGSDYKIIPTYSIDETGYEKAINFDKVKLIGTSTGSSTTIIASKGASAYYKANINLANSAKLSFNEIKFEGVNNLTEGTISDIFYDSTFKKYIIAFENVPNRTGFVYLSSYSLSSTFEEDFSLVLDSSLTSGTEIGIPSSYSDSTSINKLFATNGTYSIFTANDFIGLKNSNSEDKWFYGKFPADNYITSQYWSQFTTEDAYNYWSIAITLAKTRIAKIIEDINDSTKLATLNITHITDTTKTNLGTISNILSSLDSGKVSYSVFKDIVESNKCSSATYLKNWNIKVVDDVKKLVLNSSEFRDYYTELKTYADGTKNTADLYYEFLAETNDLLFIAAEIIKYYDNISKIFIIDDKAYFVKTNGTISLFKYNDVSAYSDIKNTDLWKEVSLLNYLNKDASNESIVPTQLEVVVGSEVYNYYDSSSSTTPKELFTGPSTENQNSFRVTLIKKLNGKYYAGGYFIDKNTLSQKYNANYNELALNTYLANQLNYYNPFIAVSSDGLNFDIIKTYSLKSNYTEDCQISNFRLENGSIKAYVETMKDSAVQSFRFTSSDSSTWTIEDITETNAIKSYLGEDSDAKAADNSLVTYTESGLKDSYVQVKASSSDSITLEDSIISDGITIPKEGVEVLLAFRTAKAVSLPETYLDYTQISDYINNGSLVINTCIESSSSLQADKVYSYRETLASDELKNDQTGYPAVSEDTNHEFYKYSEATTNGSTVYVANSLKNSSGNEIYLCDKDGNILINNNSTKIAESVVSLIQNKYSTSLYCKASEFTYESLDEASKDNKIISLTDYTSLINKNNYKVVNCNKNIVEIRILSNKSTLIDLLKNSLCLFENKDSYISKLTDAMQYSSLEDNITSIKYNSKDYTYDTTRKMIPLDEDLQITGLINCFEKTNTGLDEITSYNNPSLNFDSSSKFIEGDPSDEINSVYFPVLGYGGKIGKEDDSELPWITDPEAFEDTFAKNNYNDYLLLADSKGIPRTIEEGFDKLNLLKDETTTLKIDITKKLANSLNTINIWDNNKKFQLSYYKRPNPALKLYSKNNILTYFYNSAAPTSKEFDVSLYDGDNLIADYSNYILEVNSNKFNCEFKENKLIISGLKENVTSNVTEEIVLKAKTTYQNTDYSTSLTLKVNTIIVNQLTTFDYSSVLKDVEVKSLNLTNQVSFKYDDSHFSVDSISYATSDVNSISKDTENKTVVIDYLKDKDLKFNYYVLKDDKTALAEVEVSLNFDKDEVNNIYVYISSLQTRVPLLVMLKNNIPYKGKINSITNGSLQEDTTLGYGWNLTITDRTKPVKITYLDGSNTEVTKEFTFDEVSSDLIMKLEPCYCGAEVILTLTALKDSEILIEGISNGWVPLKVPKYANFYKLIQNMGNTINISSTLIDLTSSGNSISSIDTTNSKFILNNSLNLADGTLINLRILTKLNVVLNRNQLQNSGYYKELNEDELDIFTPDRIYLPSGYPQPPVILNNTIFNKENTDYYETSTYLNNNYQPVYLCDENGKYLTVANSNGSLVTDLYNPNVVDSRRYNILKPKYILTQDFFENQFYCDTNYGNPFWQFIEIKEYYDSKTSKIEQKLEIKQYQKRGSKLVKITTDNKFLNISKGASFIRNGVDYKIEVDTDYFDPVNGLLTMFIGQPDDYYLNEKYIILYGLKAYNSLLTEDSSFKEYKTNMYLQMSYITGSNKNFSNDFDKASAAIVELNELGIFDKNNKLIAYATFAPIEYNSETQHVSFNCFIRNANNSIK